MLETYYKYKLEYNNYLIFIKVGNFYELIDNDALIISKLFNYKLKRLTNTFKVGFPIHKLDNIISRLNEEKINYIVTDKDIKKTFENNNYYNSDTKIVYYNMIRIDKINDYLTNNLLSNELNEKISDIENILN